MLKLKSIRAAIDHNGCHSVSCQHTHWYNQLQLSILLLLECKKISLFQNIKSKFSQISFVIFFIYIDLICSKFNTDYECVIKIGQFNFIGSNFFDLIPNKNSCF